MLSQYFQAASQKSFELIFLCLAGMIFGGCGHSQQTSAIESTNSNKKILEFKPTPNTAPSLVMQFPKKIATPLKIKQLIKDKITETRTVDFDGDGKLDYLVFVRTVKKPYIADEDGAVGTETWVTSDFKIVKQERKENSSFHDRWFINLDDDPMPEVFYALLYEDSSEYSIYKQNFKDKDTLLFDLNPVISDASRQNKNYWGYAWDISNIQARYQDGEIQILCSLKYKFEYEDELRSGQKINPVIFFTGKTTQPDSIVENIEGKQWLSLEAIIESVRENTKQDSQ